MGFTYPFLIGSGRLKRRYGARINYMITKYFLVVKILVFTVLKTIAKDTKTVTKN